MDEKELNTLIDSIINSKGGTRKDYRLLMDIIGHAESTNNPKAKQRSGGPGRGYFQYEMGKNASARTAVNRTITLLKAKGSDIPKWLLNKKGKDVDYSELSLNQQSMLFLGDKMGRANADFSKIWKGEQSLEDFYVKEHWAGPIEKRAEMRKYFREAAGRYAGTTEDKFDSEVKLYDNKKTIPSYIQGNKQANVIDRTPFSESRRDFNNIPTKEEIKTSAYNEQPIDMNLNSYLNNRKIEQKNELALGGAVDSPQDEMLNTYNEGGTHTENPLGGIPIGMGANGKPNVVEEDESSFDSSEGKYIFSNKIKI